MADYFREIRILSDTLPGLEMASEAIGIPEWAKKEAKEIICVRKKAIKLLEVWKNDRITPSFIS